MLLVLIAFAANAVLEMHASALLDNVGRLVCRRVQVWRLAERDVAAGGERCSAESSRRMLGSAPDVRTDATHVVVAERALNHVDMWKRLSRAGDSGGCDPARITMLVHHAGS